MVIECCVYDYSLALVLNLIVILILFQFHKLGYLTVAYFVNDCVFLLPCVFKSCNVCEYHSLASKDEGDSSSIGGEGKGKGTQTEGGGRRSTLSASYKTFFVHRGWLGRGRAAG